MYLGLCFPQSQTPILNYFLAFLWGDIDRNYLEHGDPLCLERDCVNVCCEDVTGFHSYPLYWSGSRMITDRYPSTSENKRKTVMSGYHQRQLQKMHFVVTLMNPCFKAPKILADCSLYSEFDHLLGLFCASTRIFTL